LSLLKYSRIQKVTLCIRSSRTNLMVSNLNFHVLYLLAPHELTPREFVYPIEIGVLLAFCFICITLARVVRPSIYFSIFSGMMKTTSLRAHIRETLPLLKRGSLFLLLNYFLSSALVLYFLIGQYEIPKANQVVLSSIAPIGLLFGNLLSLLMTGWITGEWKCLKEPIIMKVLGAQTLGLFYFIYALVWVLNSSYHEALLLLIVWTFVLESVLRLIKSVKTVYGHGVSWYYIILYLCTLEILPFFVLFYFGVQ
jgi:hypothetical protein